MQTRIPRRFASATIGSTGKVTAVGEVMWLTTSRRVRPVAAAKIAATTCSADSIGSGNLATLSDAPAACSTARLQIRCTAPYSWSVSRTSSPDRNVRLFANTFIAAVAFSVKTRFRSSAPIKPANRRRASNQAGSNRRTKKSIG